MSDATELVERLRDMATYSEGYAAAQLAADWIERWAPVVSLTTELRRLDNLEAPFAEQLGMANRLESAIDVALGEDKP